jgi:pimeloyl-ACP methyl ester carboxylesterase
MPRIESLLAARLFLSPQLWRDRLYFISNLSGRFSLYRMPYGGGVPEPLIPPDIALQNPDLTGGTPYYVYPDLDKIMVVVDKDGDEVYKPMLIPLDGGFPEPAFPAITDARVFSVHGPEGSHKLYMVASSLSAAVNRTLIGDLTDGTLTQIGETRWEMYPAAISDDETRVVVATGYTVGDIILQLWQQGREGLQLLYGTPIERRAAGDKPVLSGFGAVEFAPSERGLLLTTSLFEDSYGLGYLDLERPGEVLPVPISGTVHTGMGELINLQHTRGDRYLLHYNIDGESWAYEGAFDERARAFRCDAVVCGQGDLAGGVMESIHYDRESDRFVLAFSTATSPTQLYTVEGPARDKVVAHTHERILGIPQAQLAPGEDASFTSFDGLRISARLYLPAAGLGFTGPRPLVYYVHGGPQGQERPDFAWFSMPLIQFLTLNGFAVFVPNVRGSTGYGLSYTKRVDRDWGGADRQDHVYAMTEVLPKDPRLDVTRAAVMGRSYGGYMTLTLAMRHPELWKAAVDMFGPYDLVESFLARIPETWKPYFYEAVGHPDRDRAALLERSPKTYMQDLRAPMLVIQGANDPRVVEAESHDVVETLRAAGKDVDYLVFADEGHDVIKYENKVRCYTAITEFCRKHLM